MSGSILINATVTDSSGSRSISFTIPNTETKWSSIFNKLNTKYQMNPEYTRIYFKSNEVNQNDNLPSEEEFSFDSRYVQIVYKPPKARWTTNINRMVNSGEITEEQANTLMQAKRNVNNRKSKRNHNNRKRHRIDEIGEEIARHEEIIRRLIEEAERLEKELYTNSAAAGAGGMGGGRKKRKSKRKSKAHMTKQKRKVKGGVIRNVRISSTGRKYVLLKGKKHYL